METLKVIAAVGVVSTAFFLVLWYRECMQHMITKGKLHEALIDSDSAGSALVALMWHRHKSLEMEAIIPPEEIVELVKQGELSVNCNVLPFGGMKITVNKVKAHETVA